MVSSAAIDSHDKRVPAGPGLAESLGGVRAGGVFFNAIGTLEDCSLPRSADLGLHRSPPTSGPQPSLQQNVRAAPGAKGHNENIRPLSMKEQCRRYYFWRARLSQHFIPVTY